MFLAPTIEKSKANQSIWFWGYFEAAGPDFEAAGPDFDVVGPRKLPTNAPKTSQLGRNGSHWLPLG